MFDDELTGSEERWIALGLASNGGLLGAVHTWAELDAANGNVRIVSARKANAAEKTVYDESV